MKPVKLYDSVQQISQQAVLMGPLQCSTSIYCVVSPNTSSSATTKHFYPAYPANPTYQIEPVYETVKKVKKNRVTPEELWEFLTQEYELKFVGYRPIKE